MADKPKSIQIAFRVDLDTAAAIEAERDEMGVVSFSPADVVREITLRHLIAKGRIKPKHADSASGK